MHNFDPVTNRWNTKSEKWDTEGNKEALVFTIADMDFPAPPAILRALRERLDHPILGYTLLSDPFYEAVEGFLRRRHGWEAPREWMAVTPGVMSGIGVALEAWTAVGDGIIIQPPVYTPFYRVIEKSGRKLVSNPLILGEEGYTIDFPGLEAAMKEARALLFCNPQNPTGRVFTREELEEVARLAEKHQVLLLSDEIHGDLLYSGQRHIPLATISPYAREHSLTMIAPSKTFNVPGLATSIAIIPGEALRRPFFTKLRALGLHEGNLFGIEALEAAYTRCDAWLEDLLLYLEGNRDYAAAFLRENLPEARLFLPEGTYLLWLDLRAYGEHQKILEALLQEDLVLTDGIIYGQEGNGFLRMNIGCPRQTLEEGLLRLADGLKKLKGAQA